MPTIAREHSVRPVRRVSARVTGSLAVAATALLLLAARGELDPVAALPVHLCVGGTMTAALALLLAAWSVNRAAVRRLRVEVAHLAERSPLAPETAPIDAMKASPIVRALRAAPAAFALVIGLATTAVFDRAPAALAPLAAATGLDPAGAFAATGLAIVWLAAVASAAAHRRAIRLAHEHFGALTAGRAAAERMARLPILLAGCDPDGARFGFNDRALAAAGRTDAELAGGGWLRLVAERDRHRCAAPFRSPPAPGAPSVEIVYDLDGVGGRPRRIRERLVPCWTGPCFDGYLAVGVDLTEEVQREEMLQAELAQARAAMQAAQASHEEQIRALEARLVEQAQDRDRLAGELATAANEARRMAAELAEAREEGRRTADALETLRGDQERLASENERFRRTVTDLDERVRRTEAGEAVARDRAQRSEKRLAALETSLAEAQRRETALRQALEGGGGAAHSSSHGAGTTTTASTFEPAQLAASIPATDVAPAPDDAPAPARSTRGAWSSSPGETAPDDAGAAVPRRVPRLPQELLRCNLGEVLELGTSDMRVLCPKAPSGWVLVVLPEGGGRIEIKAKVESVQRLARGRHEAIVVFASVTPALRQRVLRLAMAHRPRSALPINSIERG